MARPYRSLFWPILLVGVGVVWLLANLGYIQPISWFNLVRLWPVLLIVAGLDLLIGRGSPLVGALIGLLAVAFIIYVLVAGPSLGLGISNAPEVRTEQFTEALGGATAADVSVETGPVSSHVYALEAGSENLFDADIDHFGEVNFSAEGDATRTVRLTRDDNFSWFGFLGPQARQWEIGLSPDVPVELEVDSGSGSIRLELAELQLSGLSLDSGSGSVNLALPGGDEPYRADVTSGSGSVTAGIACGAGVELHLDTGSGSQTLDVEDGCPLRVEVNDSGSGSINLPNDLDRLEGSGDDEEGVWESADYSAGGEHILIVVDGHGSGSLNVR